MCILTIEIRAYQSAIRARNLQEEAFYLAVDGWTCREIGAKLGINYKTAAKYVKDETAQRAPEDQAAREAVKLLRLTRLRRLSRLAEEARLKPGTGAWGAVGKFEEMINKIEGVDAPIKIDTGLDRLLEAISSRPDPA